MGFASHRTFVGFGFGPIQSALFLLEARASGRFGRLVVAEVDPDVIAAVRAAGGTYTVNVARPDRIDPVRVEGVELLHPDEPADRARLLDALTRAEEIATALPSVEFYTRGGIDRLLAEALARRSADRPRLVYTAENDNHAAEKLAAAVRARAPGPQPPIQYLNTVIGKMSGVLTDAATIERLGLATLAPAWSRAVLVEEFNHILISRVTLPGATRGIEVFVEKEDLLPFEEAKLFGHNAIHALIGYLAARQGYAAMSEARGDPEILPLARAAFLEESGAALIARHARLGDPLFTPAGFQAYADDLLERMTRPTLHDQVARIIRDPVRKLGWYDRFFGAMRLARAHGIEPRRLALGAAAAWRQLLDTPADWPAAWEKPTDLDRPTRADLRRSLESLWGPTPQSEAANLVDATWTAWQTLRNAAPHGAAGTRNLSQSTGPCPRDVS